ncbi:hypothetical protein [Paraburkholderia sp. BCC1884]|uniref:hypothetical protein n=1 Tax=Paraburkholderia sp. BCC1884 TaxID=2562668 RepID=UPI0021B3F621|nr:hypothetical protein [Paraburkholderia sp. BCC1884]
MNGGCGGRYRLQTCPLLRASPGRRKADTGLRPKTRTSKPRRGWLGMSVMLLGWFGWRALRDVLDAIPDSNDDFGLF